MPSPSEEAYRKGGFFTCPKLVPEDELVALERECDALAPASGLADEVTPRVLERSE